MLYAYAKYNRAILEAVEEENIITRKKMKKSILITTLLALHLNAYEIVIDKTSTMEKQTGFTRDNAKEILTDKARGLMWQDDSSAKSVQKDWEGAKSHCQNLRHAGFDDWRLPTISELESLADVSKQAPAIKEGFKNVASSLYWSSSPFVSGSKGAWYVLFNYGYSSNGYKTGTFYVRCARAGQ